MVFCDGVLKKPLADQMPPTKSIARKRGGLLDPLETDPTYTIQVLLYLSPNKTKTIPTTGRLYRDRSGVESNWNKIAATQGSRNIFDHETQTIHITTAISNPFLHFADP
jgi:hypothetical protein